MTSSHPTFAPCQWFVRLASVLDRRSAPRLAFLLVGAVLAGGRRTVTTWIRAAGLSERFRSCYLAVAAAGKRAERVATRLLWEVVVPLAAGSGRVTLALDDTPTRRYGPYVQAAGIHHNPTPGPAGSPHVYGHVFVVLALLVEHRSWGVIALPLLSRLYARKKDLPTIDSKHRPEFRTKLVMAVELMWWAKRWLGLLRRPIWLVADGAYAKRVVLKAAKEMGITVVGRLRKDAALRTLPGPKPAGRRGPAPTYGARAIDLAKRAGQKRGWSRGPFDLYDGTAVIRWIRGGATGPVAPKRAYSARPGRPPRPSSHGLVPDQSQGSKALPGLEDSITAPGRPNGRRRTRSAGSRRGCGLRDRRGPPGPCGRVRRQASRTRSGRPWGRGRRRGRAGPRGRRPG